VMKPFVVLGVAVGALLAVAMLWSAAHRNSPDNSGVLQTAVPAANAPGVQEYFRGVAAYWWPDEPVVPIRGPVVRVEEWTYAIQDYFGTYVEGSLLSHRVTVFDDHKRPVRDDLPWRYTLAYDSSGRLEQEELFFESSGPLASRTLYSYEEGERRGRVYNGSGTLLTVVTDEFDTSGRGVKSTGYYLAPERVAFVHTYSYTTSGQLAGYGYTSYFGEGLSSKEFEYGVEGFDWVCEAFSASSGWDTYGTSLGKQDERGNWTEKRMFEKRSILGADEWVPTEITKRTLAYAP